MEYEVLKEIITEQLKHAEAVGDIVIVTPAEQGLIKRICDGIHPYLQDSMSQEEMNGVVGVLREVLYGTRFYDSEMEHTRVGVPREVLENYLRKLPPPV